MASAFPPRVIRTRVLWLGPTTELVVADYASRNLVVSPWDADVNSTTLAQSAGIVIRYDSAKPGRFVEHLKRLVASAADHGVLVCAVGEPPEIPRINYAIRRQDLRRHVLVFASSRCVEIAEEIKRRDPGPAAGDVEFSGDAIDAEALFFLRRAFHDCKSLRIKRLTAGRSGVAVRVHAVFKDSLAGPRPLPFFAKISSRKAIERETSNYKVYVEHFVPFNLRPQLDPSRTLLGATKGILVGSFVEGSETLAETAPHGGATAALYSLFDQALRGWRLQAENSDGSLLEELEGYINPDAIPAARLAAARARGATIDPKTLLEQIQAFPRFRHEVAPMHGDLHAENIQVRGSDAILIDFARVRRRGPLVADPACLEASLVFGVWGEGDKDKNAGWHDLVDRLYSVRYLRRPPPPAVEPLPREWLWNAVRQIRLIAFGAQTDPREYRTALAICLLREARFSLPSTAVAEEARKAYAYVIAERLVRDLRAM